MARDTSLVAINTVRNKIKDISKISTLSLADDVRGLTEAWGTAAGEPQTEQLIDLAFGLENDIDFLNTHIDKLHNAQIKIQEVQLK